MALVNIRRKRLTRKVIPVFPEKFNTVGDKIKWVKREILETYPGGMEIRKDIEPRPFVYKMEELDEELGKKLKRIRKELGVTEDVANFLERKLREAEGEGKIGLLKAANDFLKEFEKHPYVNAGDVRNAKKIMEYSMELINDLFKAYETSKRQEYLERAYDLLESVEPLTRVEEIRKTVPRLYLEEMKRIKKGIIG